MYIMLSWFVYVIFVCCCGYFKIYSFINFDDLQFFNGQSRNNNQRPSYATPDTGLLPNIDLLTLI